MVLTVGLSGCLRLKEEEKAEGQMRVIHLVGSRLIG